MYLSTYQKTASETRVFPSAHTFDYLSLGLCGEAGEVANKVKKVLRGDYKLDAEMKRDIALELGDCLWYIAVLAEEIGYDLDQVAHMNLFKLAERAERKKLLGDGDKR